MRGFLGGIAFSLLGVSVLAAGGGFDWNAELGHNALAQDAIQHYIEQNCRPRNNRITCYPTDEQFARANNLKGEK